MRIGTENKRRLRWTIALAAATSLLAIYNISKSLKPVPSSMPAATTSVAVPKKSHPLDAGRETRLDLDALRFSQQTMSGIGGRNIFRVQETAIKSHQSFTKGSEESSVLQPPQLQPPPRIPLTFYGFADRSPESRRAFLQYSGQIFVTKLGDTIERRYKIVAISPKSVTIEDLLQNYQQLIPLVDR